MKVALVTDGIWPNIIGGIQRHSFYLCKYLAASGVQVHLYHTNKNKTPAEEVTQLFTIQELSNISFFLIDYLQGTYFPGHYLRDCYRYSKNIFLSLQPNYASYDIIYVQGFSGWYLLKHRSKRAGPKPVCLVNMHGLEMFQRPSSFRNRMEQFMFRPFAKKQLLRSDYVQSLGGKLTGIIRSVGVPAEKIIIQGIAIESKWLRSTGLTVGNNRTFIFVGRYEERKGIAVLNEALGRLLKQGEDFTFHFVGPIPIQHQVRHNRVIYHGLAQTNDAIISVLDNADFLVVPSFSEGMPTVILEAMARGCAIIATNVGATQQLVSRENGYLIEAGDSEILYNTLRTSLQLEPSAVETMKRASLHRVKENYIWERLIHTMITEFGDITKKRAIG